MTPEMLALIAEAKRLDSAADSGPWATKITGSGESQYCDIVQADDHCAIVCVMSNSDRELDNAEFIALSRTALPALVAEVERLQRVVDQAVMVYEMSFCEEDGNFYDGENTAWGGGYKDIHTDLYAELKAREK